MLLITELQEEVVEYVLWTVMFFAFLLAIYCIVLVTGLMVWQFSQYLRHVRCVLKKATLEWTPTKIGLNIPRIIFGGTCLPYEY